MSDTKDKNRILMYMHAGSGNHGCEAIVRSLCGILDADVTVLSHKADEDLKYNLASICNVIPTRHSEDNFLTKAWFYFLRKITGNADSLMKYTYGNAKPLTRYDMAISIGGDNYCYPNALFGLNAANVMFNRAGVPTALVGCSVEPELLHEETVISDMKHYGTIITRESITYNALCEALKANATDDYHSVSDHTHIWLAPDPAFTLNPRKCELPVGFRPNHTIGINVSPMILGYENKSAEGITLKNYQHLIETILEETDESIALIPHVVTDNSDDREPLNVLKCYADQLQESFRNRVILIEDHPADELKYIISKCSMLVTARTHASIAAYSMFIPVLVVGYSVKSRGIATDLLGTTDGYVIPVQNLDNDNDLSMAWRNLYDGRDEMSDKLKAVIPDFIDRTNSIDRILAGALIK